MMTDWSKGAAWMRGEILPIERASIGVTDWGLVHSDITYDVAPVLNGGFFRLGDYIARFMESLAALRMEIGLSGDEIRNVLHAIVARSGLRDAYVAMVASRGVPLTFGSRDPRHCANHFYAWCVPYIHVVSPEIAKQGASVWIAEKIRRIPPDSVNPLVKNYHWGDFTQGLFEAKDRGFETVLLLDHAGNVTEGPGFNVFALSRGRVVTPKEGILHGITRRTILEMAEETGLPTEQRALPLAELFEAEEVWLSSTAGGVVPVTRIGERLFSNGKPGPVTSRLSRLYHEWAARPEMREEIAYDV